jgi:Domain of unknown function (DUF4157)
MGFIRWIGAALVGESEALPQQLLTRHPELDRLRLRRGGLPPRLGGWALRRSTVAAITLRRWVFLAPNVAPHESLLLHELRHVQQFEASPLFPIRYLWASLRYGYHENPFEADARDFSARRSHGPGSLFAGGR